ncbi:deleted in malignant brain tumors 1 protein-like [Lytechinus pictus]|uniref:deleted in malignant brain tumors 1 protein-like n=1 Tax=Lytechinus pictus TaxID=7653 RepID=UPI0030B9DD83
MTATHTMISNKDRNYQDILQLNNISLRLTNGTGPHEGRVEISYLDRWNGLCGKKADRTRSDLLCRSVGYDRVFAVLQHGAFGEPPNLYFDRIFCQSDDIFEACRLNLYKLNYCAGGFGGTSISCDSHFVLMGDFNIHMDAPDNPETVNFLNGLNDSSFTQHTSQPTHMAGHVIDLIITRSQCETANQDVDINLTGGGGDYEGRVEVFFDRTWGKICGNSQWTFNSADVVCRHNGYDHAFIIYYDGTFSKDNMTTVQFDEVDCEGSETNLTSCTAYRYNVGFCRDTPREAAGLTCTSESASEVDIRLAGGQGTHEGQMEFLVDRVWRKLCGKETTFQEADVFCQSLGYERSFALVQDGSAFSSSDDRDPFFDYLDCTGSEDKVTSCRMLRSKEGTCSSLYGAAAISCETDDPVNIRLVGDQESYEGRVEIFYDGSWGSICASKPWNISTSALVCSLLGYHDKNYVTFFDDDRYGDLTDPVRFDELDCKGVKTASSIKSCQLRKFSAGYCRSGYASVQCDRASTKSVPTSIQTTQAAWAVATSLRQQAQTYPTTTPFIDAFEDSSPDFDGTDRQSTTLTTMIDDVINSTSNNRSFNRNMSEICILPSPNQNMLLYIGYAVTIACISLTLLIYVIIRFASRSSGYDIDRC